MTPVRSLLAVALYGFFREHTPEVALADDRPDHRLGPSRVTYGEAGVEGGETLEEVVVHRPLDEHARAGHGRGRYTLWTGDLGSALYLQSCLCATAAFPTLDYF